MSGHSKWSTIKHQKEANDKVRGKLFSKLSKAISVAVKDGGGPDPNSNYKLRIIIESAKQANMPKENISRAISRGSGEGETIEEVVYEGFAPGGIGVIVEATTDNRNRTGQEIKNIFERSGGSLAGPGSVSYNFKPLGLINVVKEADTDRQMLTLIDTGVEDVVETPDAIEVYTSTADLFDKKEEIENCGFQVISTNLIKKPLSTVKPGSQETARQAVKLLEALEEHDDVQSVYTNAFFDDN